MKHLGFAVRCGFWGMDSWRQFDKAAGGESLSPRPKCLVAFLDRADERLFADGLDVVVRVALVETVFHRLAVYARQICDDVRRALQPPNFPEKSKKRRVMPATTPT